VPSNKRLMSVRKLTYSLIGIITLVRPKQRSTLLFLINLAIIIRHTSPRIADIVLLAGGQNSEVKSAVQNSYTNQNILIVGIIDIMLMRKLECLSLVITYDLILRSLSYQVNKTTFKYDKYITT
jgi:hypothetical protein